MFTIAPKGSFSLQESADLASADWMTTATRTSEGLIMAFCDDITWEPTAVRLTQQLGRVTVAGPTSARPQVARILGLDVDSSSFTDVGVHDPVIGRLQSAAPGLRPLQIPSVYEAAVCCVLAARRSVAGARDLRRALIDVAGTAVTVDKRVSPCLPPPSVLLDLPPVPGLDDARREQLEHVARAALDGKLHTPTLARRDPEQARRQLETLDGIGPVASAVITVRSLGHTDYLAGQSKELNHRVGTLYGLGHDASATDMRTLARVWHPWRTWAQFHLRRVAPRLIG